MLRTEPCDRTWILIYYKEVIAFRDRAQVCPFLHDVAVGDLTDHILAYKLQEMVKCFVASIFKQESWTIRLTCNIKVYRLGDDHLIDVRYPGS